MPPESSTAQLTCQRCNRVILGEIPRCVYCGWTEDAQLAELEDLGRVRRERFRTAATLWPFIFWGGLLGGLALVIAPRALEEIQGTEPGHMALLQCCTLLLFGPAITAARLLHRARVWVQVEPDEGLSISGGAVIPWEQIAALEHDPGLLGYRRSMQSLIPNFPSKISCR